MRCSAGQAGIAMADQFFLPSRSLLPTISRVHCYYLSVLSLVISCRHPSATRIIYWHHGADPVSCPESQFLTPILEQSRCGAHLLPPPMIEELPRAREKWTCKRDLQFDSINKYLSIHTNMARVYAISSRTCIMHLVLDINILTFCVQVFS